MDPKCFSIMFWNVFMGAVQFDENRIYNGGRSYLKPTLDEAILIIVRGLKSRV